MTKRVKRRKLKIKRIIVLFTIIVAFITLLLQYNNIKILYLSKTTKYQKDTIAVFLENEVIDEIKKNEYSQTLEEVVKTNDYNLKYLNEYLSINYIQDDNFLDNIGIFLDLGYTSSDINQIYEKLSSESVQILIEQEYIKDLIMMLNLDYFREDKLLRYIAYYKQNDKAIEDIITYVNIGLDKNYYTNVTKIEDEENLEVLVNKYNNLSADFVPKKLKVIASKYQWLGRSNQLIEEAAIAFEKMCDAALKEKIVILAGSGYRSYNHQKSLYNNYVAQDGFAEAETYSARPGYSEHQTGLAMDIANKAGFIDKNDKEYTWLINNSYKFGFILRYPENKDKITGYMYEEWHYRYVGVDVAKEVYESGLTYDEYAARKIS